MERNLDFYMENPDDFAGLSEEDKARLYAGGTLEGDTAKVLEGEVLPAGDDAGSSEPPAAATTPAAEPAATGPVESAEPVILTKDGKHTIPFEELATARERATQLERENAQLAERLKQQEVPAAAADTPPVEAPAPAADQIDLDALEDQCYEAGLEGDKEQVKSLRKQINAEIQRRAEAAATERFTADRAATEAATTEQTAFSTAVAKAVADYPFLDINSPDKNVDAINTVREWRDLRISQGAEPSEALAEAAAKFGPIYATAKPTLPATPAGATPTAAEKAAQAIANAKAKVPNSLSDVPAGTAAHHDEAGALLQMGNNDLMTKFAGKTPEQIEALMSKVI